MLCVLILACSVQCGGGFAAHAPVDKIRGVTLDARRAPPDSVLPALANMGVTHITLISFAYQRELDVPTMRMQPDANWYSESDRGIKSLARQADSLGMQIIVKPHIWVGRYSADGQTRADIGFGTEADWLAWEEQYHAFLMHYARLAAETNAALLVVGTELHRPIRERPQFWRALIADIRAVYPGALTYAANWWEEYEDVTFWDALDFIGIQGYFELSAAPDPSKSLLLAGWESPKQSMQRLAERTGRPVLFTELGYRNAPDAAAAPWRWPSRAEAETAQPADALQARLFDAFFESLWHEPWFAGVILWKWTPQPARRQHYLDFSPQGKPAEAVIERWFNSNAQ